MIPLSVVVLAAGLGTRMKSQQAKVLHRVAGRPMIEYPVGLAHALGARRVVAVLGHQLEAVKAAIDARFGAGSVEVALQAEQRGTGHAVMQAAPHLAGEEGLLLILCGDVPLLTESVLRRLVEAAGPQRTAMLTFRPPSPQGYGRIVRDADGRFLKIVEHKDATPDQLGIGEVNAGVYCGPTRFIVDALGSLRPDNAQGELYLTDVIEQAARAMEVVTIECPTEEVMGINDRVDLARADRVMRLRIAERHLRAGVTMADPDSVRIDPDVELGRDVELGPGVELRGKTRVGDGCRLEAGVVLADMVLGRNVHIRPYCVLTESEVRDDGTIGPFAHVRPGSLLEEQVHIGNFVETKKARLGRGTKAGHLTYLGDAEIGANVNIGCGTITCNYDGYRKSKTIVGDDVFVGSDTQLVAPVTVGKGAVIGAGTTVYEDVPENALALTRTRQLAVPAWAAWKRASEQAKKDGTPPPPRPSRPAEPRPIGSAGEPRKLASAAKAPQKKSAATATTKKHGGKAVRKAAAKRPTRPKRRARR